MSLKFNDYENFGLPRRWQDDKRRELPGAVLALFRHRAGGERISSQEIELVRQYCEYYINAPGWIAETMQSEFADLRERVKLLRSVEDIDAWLNDALKIGIDPF